MKRIILFLLLAVFTALISGCKSSEDGVALTTTAEILTPSIFLESSESGEAPTQQSKIENNTTTVPKYEEAAGFSTINLEDSTVFAEQLSHSDTAKLWITLYDANYTVENADMESFVIKDGRMEENSMGSISSSFSMGEPASAIYKVPFSGSYRFSYERPHEDCYFKVSWVTNEAFASVRGSGIQSVECSLSGVRVTGEDMQYTIKFYLPNADQAIMKVYGEGEAAVCLMRTEDGFRFYCETGAILELPDFYESSAVKKLEIPAGSVGVLEGISKGYDAELYTEPFPD